MERVSFEGFGGVTLVGDAFGPPDRPPVLLVPSAGQTREVWHGAAGAFAEAGRHAICIDLRGHGDSDPSPDGRYDLNTHVADLRAVLAALPSRACLVAAGLGALAAIAAIGESATSLVAGLALVDVNIWFDESQYDRRRDALLLRTTRPADLPAVLEAMSATHPEERHGTAGSDRLLAAFTRDAEGHYQWRGDPRALATEGLRGQQERLQAAAARIGVPVVLVRGALHSTIPEETMRRLQALIPNAEVAEIEGVGHFMASDQEDAVDSILLGFLERHAPLLPLTYLGGSEPRVLRDALGCFGTGVTVITTLDPAGEPIGLTANSFTSVSLDPPLILFSIARSSANLGTFEAAGRFAVNVLHIGQQPVAGRFASRNAPRFQEVDWSIRSENGSPILAGSLASFDCATYAVHPGGDHVIFIGAVRQAWFEPNRDPLLYFRGRYRRLHFS